MDTGKKNLTATFKRLLRPGIVEGAVGVNFLVQVLNRSPQRPPLVAFILTWMALKAIIVILFQAYSKLNDFSNERVTFATRMLWSQGKSWPLAVATWIAAILLTVVILRFYPLVAQSIGSTVTVIFLAVIIVIAAALIGLTRARFKRPAKE